MKKMNIPRLDIMRIIKAKDILEKNLFNIGVLPSTANLKYPKETLKKEEPNVITKNLNLLLKYFYISCFNTYKESTMIHPHCMQGFDSQRSLCSGERN
jgi:hypothetical protein